MEKKLERYRGKRNFSTTPEPKGRARARGGAPLSFVVQKHHARRLHYDFRLELDGVLKSWAVPKGPSLDPNDKRLAVHVEDHPLDYGGFEGTIPAGQYGAGSVIVWDRGDWIPLEDPHAGYRAGKLKFELRGEKLHGAWTLVRMRNREKQETWLLIKERDAQARPSSRYNIVDVLPDSVLDPDGSVPPEKPKATKKSASAARKKSASSTGTGRKAKATRAASAFEAPAGARRAELPALLEPQLATLVTRVPPGDEWSYEIKLDGYRILTRGERGRIQLLTRNGNDWTERLPELAAVLSDLRWQSGWLDGEILVPRADGVPDFQALQNAFDASRTDSIQYFVFDLLFRDGYDLRRVPLFERREQLRALLRESALPLRVQFSENFQAPARELLDKACAMHLEGVIGKQRDSTYRAGRSAEWIKLKCRRQQEFVIGGFTDPKNSRVGIGALLLGVFDADGALRYVGKVGSGFNETSLRALSARLTPLRRAEAPFNGIAEQRPSIRGHWVEPRLVAQVEFSQWTDDGRIRQAVFQGLREDKPSRAVTREAAADIAPAAPPRRRRTVRGGAEVAGIAISHPDRIIDARSGCSKLALARYYETAAPYLLPQLEGRPVSLTRAPTGVDGELFFQKHADTLRIPGLRRLDRRLFAGHPPLLAIDSLETLIGAVQMNVIEFHTWNACESAIGTPDRITFDLDPGAGIEWPQIIDAARLTKTLLDELGLHSFLKTSGGKGLHIVVPLVPRANWETVKRFAHAVTTHLAKTLPTLFVAKSGPNNRVGRIFVDYLRNTRGATTVAAFSARARPGLGVSMPLAWGELSRLRASDQWNAANTPARLARWRDPWADYERRRQTLEAAMAALGVSEPHRWH